MADFSVGDFSLSATFRHNFIDLCYDGLSDRRTFEEKYSRSLSAMELCDKLKIRIVCDDCGHVFYKPYLCHVRYCSHDKCVDSRIIQTYRRLNHIFPKNRFKKFFTFVIGSNVRSKAEIQAYISKWLQKMRSKYGYKFKYIKCFDIGRDSYTKDNSNPYWKHFHFYCVLEGFMKYEILNKRAKKILQDLGSKCEFSNGGLTRRSGMFNYIAKRNAGKLGHKKEGYYYYDDIMTKREFFEEYYKSKFISYSLRGISPSLSSIEAHAQALECPKCGGSVTFDGYEMPSSVIQENYIGDLSPPSMIIEKIQ